VGDGQCMDDQPDHVGLLEYSDADANVVDKH